MTTNAPDCPKRSESEYLELADGRKSAPCSQSGVHFLTEQSEIYIVAKMTVPFI